MEKIARKLTDLVGNTPLLELSNYNKSNGLKARLIVKIESFNPAGSVKDRVALAMIEDAEVKGVLTPGATIIEPTSGNTGVGLAFVAAAKGYKLILTMPDTMSVERRNLLKALGAELVLTPGADGMKGAVGANGETAVADDDLDVQVGQANGITCNFKTPFCKEGVRAGQRNLADGGQTGCRTEEVLFGNADIEEPFRCLVFELFCPCRRGNIRIDDDDVRIFIDFRFQDMTVCIPC